MKGKRKKTAGTDTPAAEIHSLESEAEALPPEGIGQMLHHGEVSEYTSPSEDQATARKTRSKVALQSATQRNSPSREKILDPVIQGSHKPADDHQVPLTRSVTIPKPGITPRPRLRQTANLPPSSMGHRLPEAGNWSRLPSEARRQGHCKSDDNTLQQMLELLNGSGDSADRADQVTKHAQAAAAEALEASKEANDQHDCLRELVIKLQRSHERTHSQHSFAESQAVQDLVTDQQADLVNEGHSLLDTSHQERAHDGETDEPVGLSVVMPAWIAQPKLWNKWALMTQHVGQLYEANTDPAVLNEAVARAQEA
jgi:hypothetical protein